MLGSSVSVAALDAGLNPTGQVFTTQTVDNAGRFTVELDQTASDPLSIEGTGFYYNEVTGELSTAQLTLRALDQVPAGAHDAYLNVVTHLAYQRATRLARDGMPVVDAEAQAEAELRAALRVGPVGFDPGAPGLELTILEGDTDPAAYLLAASSVLVQAAVDRGGPVDAALQELLNTLALDLADDGSIAPPNTDALLTAQQGLDTDRVETQLAARLAEIGSSAVVPDIDRMIDSDLDGLLNIADNCRRAANFDQADADADGVGDACDTGVDAYVKGPTAQPRDQFGLAVAASGDTLVVGAPGYGNADDGFFGPGRVYVYARSAGIWTQQAILEASNADPRDAFGISVAIDGDTIVVGAHYEESAAVGVNGDQTDDSMESAGAAYVFTRSGTTWTQQAYLKASIQAREGQYFGGAVAIAGDTVAVGASQAGDVAEGVVFVFLRSGDTWTPQADLYQPDPQNSAHFGGEIALDGDTIVIGASFHRYLGEYAGATYVFARSGATWTQQAFLLAPDRDFADSFGIDVDIDGDTLVVGAYGDDSNGTPGDESVLDSGAVYVFTRSGTTWTQQAYLKASTIGREDMFGTSVALEGDTLVVGAFWEDSASVGVGGDETNNGAIDSGAAYVFTRSGTVWTQQSFLKASNTGADDRFGVSACIAGDIIAVGAPYEDGAATGVHQNPQLGGLPDDGAERSGAVYLY